MRNSILNVVAICLVFVLLASVGAKGNPQTADVTGTWNIKVSGDAGSADQTIVLRQDGNKIAGKFKGPRQSGELEGTLDGNAIQFHVKAHVPLDYAGTVDGDTMKGTMTGKGKTGNWTAARAK